MSVVIDKLYFPNGIVYEKNKGSVIVGEINRHRLIRVFVEGPKKGSKEILIDNLHGYPDNIKFDDDGNILVAFPAVRDAIMTKMDRLPFMRKILLYVPEKLLNVFANLKCAGGIRINPKTG